MRHYYTYRQQTAEDPVQYPGGNTRLKNMTNEQEDMELNDLDICDDLMICNYLSFLQNYKID